MAEVVAITASVIQIIQITDRVIGLCKFYIGSVHDAPSDLRRMLIETSALKTVLGNLNFLITCNSDVSTLVATIAGGDGPIEGCRRAIAEMEKLFPSDFVQTVGQNGIKKPKVNKAFAALAWPFKESKAKKLLEEMMSYKMTICLAITTDSR